MTQKKSDKAMILQLLNFMHASNCGVTMLAQTVRIIQLKLDQMENANQNQMFSTLDV
jgi:hypothetical protein